MIREDEYSNEGTSYNVESVEQCKDLCSDVSVFLFYLFGVLRRFQYCTGPITTSSWKGRGNQYIQLVKVLYCKLLTNGKLLPAFPLQAVPGTEPRPQRWEARVLRCSELFLNNTLMLN